MILSIKYDNNAIRFKVFQLHEYKMWHLTYACYTYLRTRSLKNQLNQRTKVSSELKLCNLFICETFPPTIHGIHLYNYVDYLLVISF